MASTYELILKAVDQTSGPLRNIERSLKNVEKQSRRTGRAFDNVGGTKVSAGVGAVGGAVSRLSGPLLAAGAAATTLGLGFKAVIDSSKEIQNIENGLRLVTKSTADLNATMSLLRDLAVQNRTAFSDTADLYTKLSIATSELGMGQKDVIGLTTRLSQALAVAGADATTTSSVIRQFGQAMASGAVRGDEFVSISEGLGPALAIMAKESGLTIGKLREMSQEGELTAKAFAEILLNSNALEESFGKLAATTDQLETALSDATTRLLVEFGKATGITDGYNNVLEGTTQMFNDMATILSTMNTPLEAFTEQMKELIDGGNTESALAQIKKRMAALSAPLFGDQLKDEREVLIGLMVDAKRLAKEMENTSQKTKTVIKPLSDIELAMGGIAAYKDIVNQALGTDAEFELATPLEQLKMKLKETQTALSAYREDSDLLSKSVEEGGMGIIAYTKAVRGLSGQITILEKAIEDEKEALELANDPLLALSKQYGDLHKRYSEVSHASYVLNEALKKTDGTSEQRFQLMMLNQELARLREQMGFTEQNAGQIVANEATDNLAKYKKQLEEVNERLKTYSKQEAGITTRSTEEQLNVIIVALKKEKEELTNKIDTLNGVEKAQKKVNEKTFTYAVYLEDLVKQSNRSAKENEYLQRVTADLDAKLKAGTISLDTYAEAMKTVKSRMGEISETTITFSDVMEAFFKSNEQGFKTLENFMKQTSESISKNLATSLVTSKNLLGDFKSFFMRILDDIAIAIVQKRITDPFIDGLIGMIPTISSSVGSSNFLSNLVGGIFGRAAGGPVSGNKPYLVGEQGPELFMPSVSGSITPNDELNTGGGTTNITFEINAIDTQSGTQFLLENKPKIISMVTQAQNQRGRQGITT